MKAFLTGGSGFVGGHVLRALVAAGARVKCLVRESSPRRNLDGLDVDAVVGDLREAGLLARALDGSDAVFHCAADYRLFVRRPAEMYATNVDGTRNLLQASARAGVRRFVHTSSVGALGLERGGVADETTPVALADMIGHYKRSKFLADRVVDDAVASGLPVVSVHPSTPVGEGDLKPTPTGKIILDFLNRQVPAFVDTGLNFVDVRDVAAGHLLAAERGRVGARYILGHSNMTLAELFEILGRLTGLEPPKISLPHWVPLGIAAVSTAAARVFGGEPRVPLEAVRMSRHRMFFSAEKAVADLGLPQTPVEEALYRAIRWFVENGYVHSSAKMSLPEAARGDAKG